MDHVPGYLLYTDGRKLQTHIVSDTRSVNERNVCWLHAKLRENILFQKSNTQIHSRNPGSASPSYAVPYPPINTVTKQKRRLSYVDVKYWSM